MIPYTYLIIFKPTNQWYYGVRFSKNCTPNDLWIKYFTSSKTIKQLIKQYGTDVFYFEVRKTFNNPRSAQIWESKVLKRMKISNGTDCLNIAVSTNFPEIKDYTAIQKKVKQTSKEKYGVDHFLAAEEIKNKMKSTFKEKYGVERLCDIPHVKEKKKKLNLGTIWVKHPQLGQKRIKPELLQEYICQGYVRGLNKQKCNIC